MKIDRDGTDVRLRLSRPEIGLLSTMFDELLVALDEMGPGDAVWERFYPSVYDEVDAAEEFREMVGEDLDNARRERISACRAEIEASTLARPRREILMGPESLERWLMALNDVRLSLGTALGITAEDGGHLDPRDPQVAQRAAYGWLTWCQQELVDAAIGGNRG